MNVTFKIFRFDPSKDGEPYYKNYMLDIDKGTTILDCLNEIKWHQDGSLTYRRSCRSAVCGTCAVTVNHHARLACKTQVVDIISIYNTKEILIEPLKNHEVIRDLVVNKDMFWDGLKKMKPWLLPEEKSVFKKPHKMLPEQVAELEKSIDCIMCGICNATCDIVAVNPKYIGPCALTKAYRFIEDNRDTCKIERLKIVNKNGLWDCTHSYGCVERCPKKVEPAHAISCLRAIVLEQKVGFNPGTRHAEIFTKGIKWYGKPHEVLLLAFTRLLATILVLPLGIKLFIHGKFPEMFPKKIKKHKDIKEIYKAYNQ